MKGKDLVLSHSDPKYLERKYLESDDYVKIAFAYTRWTEHALTCKIDDELTDEQFDKLMESKSFNHLPQILVNVGDLLYDFDVENLEWLTKDVWTLHEGVHHQLKVIVEAVQGKVQSETVKDFLNRKRIADDYLVFLFPQLPAIRNHWKTHQQNNTRIFFPCSIMVLRFE